MAGKARTGVTLLETLVVVGIIVTAAAILTPMAANCRASSKKRDCTSNLKQIGLYLNLYCSKFGRETAYPPTNTSPNFLDYLRQIPTSTTAIAANSHGIFVCKVAGTMPGPNALDYRYPNVWRTIDETCDPSWPIACDHPNNHGEDDMNVLLFDGSVQSTALSSRLWDRCASSGPNAWMQGPPNPHMECPTHSVAVERVFLWVFLIAAAAVAGFIVLKGLAGRSRREGDPPACGE
ncbi:MAG: hypothetical protein RDV41_01005 [Planctomycetota bacterium]|nr:hypothetical protein [Planctomycetota bacterium]